MLNITSIVEYIIVIEYLLVLLVTLFIYLIYTRNILQQKRKAKEVSQLRSYIKEKLETDKNLDQKQFFSKFPKKLQNLGILLRAIEFSGVIYKNEARWKGLRKQILLTIALPIARRKANSIIMKNRLLAAQVFSLYPLKRDEHILLKLQLQKNQLISMHALKALIGINSAAAIKSIISSLSRERYLNQSISLNLFKNASIQIAQHVIKELKDTENPYKREICYKILTRCKLQETSLFPPDKDIYSDNLLLKIAVTKFLARCDSVKATPILLKFLKDPEWQIRMAALQSLGHYTIIDIPEAIVECLSDKNWWVRFNAANILKNFGKPGLLILKSQDKQKDLFAFETAQFVLGKEG